MEDKIQKLEEQIEFLKALMKIYCVTQLDESMFQDWKNKKGIFINRK